MSSGLMNLSVYPDDVLQNKLKDMEQLRTSMIKSLMAIAVGIILLLWPDSSLNTLIIMVGALLITFGLFLIANAIKKRKGGEIFNIVSGIISLGLGVLFLVIPATLSNVIFYIIAVILIIGALYQMINGMLDKERKISVWTYVLSVILILIGILIFLFPDFMSTSLFIILGVIIIIYGIRGLYIWFKS